MDKMNRQLLFISGMVFLLMGCNFMDTASHLNFYNIDKDLREKSLAKRDSSTLLVEQNPNSRIEFIHEHAEQLAQEFSDIRKSLEEVALEDDAQTPNYEDDKKQMIYMIGNDGMNNGRGYDLEKKLNDYINSVNSIMQDFDFEKIAKRGSEIEQFKNTEYGNKDFVYLNFENTPMIATFAILSEMELEVRKVELKAIRMLIEKEIK